MTDNLYKIQAGAYHFFYRGGGDVCCRTRIRCGSRASVCSHSLGLTFSPPSHPTASPELASLMRRLKTIYAITGGEVPKSTPGKKDGFNEKKSILIAQLANFDKLLDSRDNSGLASDSRDFIRLKLTIGGELSKLESMVKDLAETNKKEVEKRR